MSDVGKLPYLRLRSRRIYGMNLAIVMIGLSVWTEGVRRDRKKLFWVYLWNG